MKINNLALCLLAAGLAPIAALPALAGQSAYANGSSTIVLMNGASQSIAAEIGLPTGAYFTGATATSGNVLVTPILSNTSTTGGLLATNANAFASLNVNAGLPGTSSSILGSSFTGAAAAALTAASTLDAQVSIIRAGAGVDGLE